VSAPASKVPLVVLASGNGSNLQAILDACQGGELPTRVAAVFSDRAEAFALERARRAQVPALYFPWKPFAAAGRDRRAYDAALAREVTVYQPVFVVLAGWMRLLSSAFLQHFPMRVINLHPALPGKFPGTHAIPRALQAWQAGQISCTGVMVHYVPDEGVDDGPLIAQEVVDIQPSDTLETLEARIHTVEHRLLVAALRLVIARPVRIQKEE